MAVENAMQAIRNMCYRCSIVHVKKVEKVAEHSLWFRIGFPKQRPTQESKQIYIRIKPEDEGI